MDKKITKTLEEIIQNFTSEEQAEIQSEANKLIAEEMERQQQQKQDQKKSESTFKMIQSS